jgi:8-oxo-dGTP pyrophosphatase MutT (NUDIX family)
VPEFEVNAGGGVVWRRAGDGVEVAVVHRPRYEDWSLPKGKVDPGETFEQAALREVEEETGLRCELGTKLPDVTYDDHKGRSKLVRYWTMTPEPGAAAEFIPNDEVDDLRWLPPAEASRLLSYEPDRELIDGLDTEALG